MGLKESGLRGSLRNVSVGIDAIPDSGGTHQWNKDEGDGSEVADGIGSLDGTINGASWASDAGAGGFYLDYDSTDDYVEILTGTYSDFNHFTESGEGTFAIWLRPDTIGRYDLIGGGRSSDLVNAGMRINDDGSWQFWAFDGSGNSIWDIAGSSATSDEWQFVAGTADGSTARIYEAKAGDNYDVSEVASASIDSGNFTTNDWDIDFDLGRDGRDLHYFDGGLDMPWTDDSVASESRLQEWVDDTKEFYE